MSFVGKFFNEVFRLMAKLKQYSLRSWRLISGVKQIQWQTQFMMPFQFKLIESYIFGVCLPVIPSIKLLKETPSQQRPEFLPHPDTLDIPTVLWEMD